MYYGCESLVAGLAIQKGFDEFRTDSSMAKAASLGGCFSPK